MVAFTSRHILLTIPISMFLKFAKMITSKILFDDQPYKQKKETEGIGADLAEIKYIIQTLDTYYFKHFLVFLFKNRRSLFCK